MELLYVWVEEYGNIRKQGFNFSPNYDFEVKKQENGEYILVDNFETSGKKKQPENFFGDNISNITAIVGKNGSGKSTFLECIREIFNSNSGVKKLKKTEVKIINSEGKNFETINSYCYENEILKNKVYFFGTFNINTNNSLIKEPKTIFFTNQFGELFSKNTIGFGLDISLYKNFLNNMNRDKDIAEIKNNRINLLGELNKNNKTKIAGIKYPEKIIIEKFEYDILGRKISTDKSIEELFLKLVNKTIEELFIPNSYVKSFKGINDIQEILDEINNKDKFIYNRYDIYNKYSTEYSNRNEVKEKNRKADKSYYNFLLNVKFFYDEYLKDKEIVKEYLLKDKLILDLINLYNYTYIGAENEWLSFRYEPYLSSGEEHMLSLYGQFYNELKSKKDGNYIILIDEPEIYMHPEWQRNIINSINEFFSKVLPNNNYQIILTSHSPFVASDLPRENVIMLDTDKEGNCIVKNDKKDKAIKTFGANIFDLYKDSFFVNDFMGEFAKNKITKEVIDKLKTDNLTSEDFRNMEDIVNLIGDEILSTILNNKIRDKRTEDRTVEDIINNFSDEEIEEASKLLSKRSEKQ